MCTPLPAIKNLRAWYSNENLGMVLPHSKMEN